GSQEGNGRVAGGWSLSGLPASADAALRVPHARELFAAHRHARPSGFLWKAISLRSVRSARFRFPVFRYRSTSNIFTANSNLAGYLPIMTKFLSLMLASCLAASVAVAADEKIQPLPLGADAPNFNLPGVDGRNWALKDFGNSKVLVVVFTCVHCPTAQAYEERLKKLVEDYKSRGVAFVAISPNDPRSVRLDELGYTDLGDSFDDMKIRAKEKAFNFPFLYDGETEEVSRKYGPLVTPHAFVFDAARKLR